MDQPEKLEVDDCPVTEGCFRLSSPGCVDTGWTPSHLYQHPVCRDVAAAHNQSPDAEDECHHMTTIHKMCNVHCNKNVTIMKSLHFIYSTKIISLAF